MFKDFYHLKAEPFSTHPNPGIIFISNTHKEAWYYLLFGIDTQEPFLVLTGEYGMGKTLLCLRLIQVLKKKGKPPVEYISTPGEGYGGILRRIAHHLNISIVPEDEAVLQDMIYDYFREGTQDSRFYLIIDDAHELDTEALTRLKHLSSFNHNGFFPIVMVFVAHPSFLQGLQTPALKSLNQRIKRRYQLSRFSFEDTKNYIYFRLLKSGASGLPVFPEETLQKIFEYSGGVPRLINNICDTCLLIGASRELTVIPPEVVDNAKDLVEGSLIGSKSEVIVDTHAMTEALEEIETPETPEPLVTISEEIPTDVSNRENDDTTGLKNAADADEESYIKAPLSQHSSILKKLGTVLLIVVSASLLLICGAVLSQLYTNPHFTISSLLPAIQRQHMSEAVNTTAAEKPVAAEPPHAAPSSRSTDTAPQSTKAALAAPILRDEEPDNTSSLDSSATEDSSTSHTETVSSAPKDMAPATAENTDKPVLQTSQTDTSTKSTAEYFIHYPFSLRYSSYQKPSHALQDISDVRQKGLTAYLVPISLGDMGIWWRIYIGYYPTEAEAKKVRSEYKIANTIVDKTEYACLVGDYSTETDIQAAFEKLKQLGFYPYVIQTAKDHFLLYVGAYGKKIEAAALNQELETKGFHSLIAKR